MFKDWRGGYTKNPIACVGLWDGPGKDGRKSLDNVGLNESLLGYYKKYDPKLKKNAFLLRQNPYFKEVVCPSGLVLLRFVCDREARCR